MSVHCRHVIIRQADDVSGRIMLFWASRLLTWFFKMLKRLLLKKQMHLPHVDGLTSETMHHTNIVMMDEVLDLVFFCFAASSFEQFVSKCSNSAGKTNITFVQGIYLELQLTGNNSYCHFLLTSSNSSYSLEQSDRGDFLPPQWKASRLTCWNEFLHWEYIVLFQQNQIVHRRWILFQSK